MVADPARRQIGWWTVNRNLLPDLIGHAAAPRRPLRARLADAGTREPKMGSILGVAAEPLDERGRGLGRTLDVLQ